MDSYPSEKDLLVALDRCDRLIRACASGRLSFADFRAEYNDFYWSFALDGHESDQAGQALLARYASRIAPHQRVSETILAKVCSDTDASQEIYRAAGRFGSTEAVARLKLVAEGLPGGEA
jgi:hypothetical protein